MHRRSAKPHIESGKKPKDIYYHDSKDADLLINQGCKAFKEFKKYQCEKRNSLTQKERAEFSIKEIDAIKRALSFFENAIKNSSNKTDIAYCERKYASIIIRNESMNEAERYQCAKNALISSIDHYQESLLYKVLVAKIEALNFNFSPMEIVIIVEMQRALSALAQVALSLRDGFLLTIVIEKLFLLLNVQQNITYYRDALTYQYHLNLSQNNLVAAQAFIEEIIKLNDHMKFPNDTDYRHLAKINLLQAEGKDEKYFEDKIKNNFWHSFDKHKVIKNREDFERHKHALAADFCMLLHIKTVQHLYGKETKQGESVYQYMQRQIRAVFKKNKSYYDYFMALIKHVIADYQKTNKISLAFKLFKDIEPPFIAIEKEKFDQIFSDYLEIRKKDLAENLPGIPVPDEIITLDSQEKSGNQEDTKTHFNPQTLTIFPQETRANTDSKNEFIAPAKVKSTLNPNAPAFTPAKNVQAGVYILPRFFNVTPQTRTCEQPNCIYTNSNH